MKDEMSYLKWGCACAIVLFAAAIVGNIQTILRLVEKLIDKL